MKTLNSIDVAGKKVLVRADFNVPMENGKITSDARIHAALPTVKKILECKGQVILMSHLGRPTEGTYDESLSLKPIADHLSKLLSREVEFIKDGYLDGVNASSDIVMLENTRFLVGEKKSNEELSKKLAAICDVFVMDAFATSHRSEASTCGVIAFAKEACAGLLLEKEVGALDKILVNPDHPSLAVVGGSKVSTKLPILESVAAKTDQMIVGGGIANTFLLAKGFNIGKSLCEPDLVEQAKSLMNKVDIPLPVDAVVAKEFSSSAQAIVKDISDISDDDMIFDVGPKTVAIYDEVISKVKTVLLNGPVGVFEFFQFSSGTKDLLASIVKSGAFSVAGGGDTVSAIEQFGYVEKIGYISTAGGAFLEYLEGKDLPAIAALKKRS